MKYKNIFKLIFEYEQKVFVILFAVFFIGFLFGSFFVFFDGNAVDTSVLFEYTYTQLFTDVLVKNLILMIVMFVLGYTAIGSPVLFFCILYSGIYLGVLISSFTYTYGFKGCIASSLMFFPYYLLLVCSLFFITFSSLRLSVSLFNVFKSGTRYISPKKYCKPHILKFVFFSAITLLSSFIFSFISIPVTHKIL